MFENIDCCTMYSVHTCRRQTVLQSDFDRVSSWTVAFLTHRLLLWLRNLGYTWFSVHCLVYGSNLLKWEKKSSKSLFADRLDFQPVLCVSMIHAIIHEKEYVLKALWKPSLLHTTKTGKTNKVEIFFFEMLNKHLRFPM